MSVTETCMIESDPALVLTAGITDPEQVQMLCADFFAREKEKEASYKKLPGLDLPYIYIAMMAGVPEVELEKGIPGTEPSENETSTKESSPKTNFETNDQIISNPVRKDNEKRSKEDTRRQPSSQAPDYPKETYNRRAATHRETTARNDTLSQKETPHREMNSHRDTSYQKETSHHNSSPTNHSHSGYSSRSMSSGHSHSNQHYSYPDPHLHRRQDHSQHLHPHRGHGVYSHPQPPPIYHHGIPTTELSPQQHLHTYYPMQAQYKEPAFQLTADLYQTPTNYSFKPNPSVSSMDPHAPKFSMGPRQSSKRNSNYPPMHHRQHSPTMGKTTDFYPDVTHLVNYNIGLPFNPNQKQTKFFILTSTVEENIFQSIRYGVWSSTSRGNKTLQTAINDGNSVILFYGAARMDYMYGCAEMKSSVDFDALTGLWHDDNWKGKFHVKWFYLKNVPKIHLANISEYNNPFRMCRDGMEVPWDVARKALDLFKSFKARESLLDKSIDYRSKLLHKTLKC